MSALPRRFSAVRSDALLTEAARCLAGASALALLLAAPPLAAQQMLRQSEQGLKDLIPDSALDNPEQWAKAPTSLPTSEAEAPPVLPGPPAPPPVAVSAETLKPDSPLQDIAGLDLPWPEGLQSVPAAQPLAAETGAQQALSEGLSLLPEAARAATPLASTPHSETVLAGGKARLVWAVDPAQFPMRAAMEARFRQLSSLQAMGAHEADALTQVVVRAAADRKLLEKLLRVYGYYDGEVVQTLIAPAGARVEGIGAEAVRFDIQPGQRFQIGVITTGDLDQTGSDARALRASMGLEAGDPLALDTIAAAQTRLQTALGEAGYPFAAVPAPAVEVDHASTTGDVAVAVKNGGKYRFGAITSNMPRFMSGHHLAGIARFKSGEPYRKSEVEDLRRAILATGLVAGVAITPRESAPPEEGKSGVAALDVVMSKAPLRTIAGEIGYDTGQGARIAASWEHRNLFPPEGALKFRGIAGTNEQLAGVTLRRSNFLGRDRVISADLYTYNATLTAYAARKVAFVLTYERLTNVLFQKPWTWSVGLETQASEEREGVPSGIIKGRIRYYTAALPLRGSIDRTDDLLDPTRGHRLSLRISPEHGWALGTQADYMRVQGDASGYIRAGQSMVLAGRLRLGAMPGTEIDNVAPSRRFYAGGGASIRGYAYQLVGPRNALGEAKGGRSLYEFSLEARITTPLLGKALQIVPFLDGGGVEEGVTPQMNAWRYGAGLGVRYKTGFGPIRVDVGMPINRRPGESPVGVYVALGQAF